MARRKKTVRFPINFGSGSGIVTATTQSFGSFVVYTPENIPSSNISCSSAMIYVAVQDTSTATGATLSNFQTNLSFPGRPTSSVNTSVGTLANSGENWGGILGPYDYYLYFTSSYTSSTTAKSASLSVAQTTSTGTGTNITGAYAWMDLTYEYDDSATRRIKTICIPYESGISTLTTTTNTTFCTLPQLTGAGGWLAGYANVTIRNRWLEIKGNCTNNNTTGNYNLFYSFDSGTESGLTPRTSALASDTWQMYQINAASLSTTATHTFQLRNSLASRWANIIVNEWITFEYDIQGTTSVLNYIELPVEFDSPIPGTTSASALRFKRPLTIQEPNTITLRKAAAEIYYSTAANATLAIKGGTQASYRSYTGGAANSVACGILSFNHGLDSDSASGTAFSSGLVRGENNIILDLYRSAGSAYNVTGVVKLLYSSPTSSQGIDSHSDTRRGLLRQMNLTTVTDDTIVDSFNIPDSNYWLQGLAINNHYWITTTGATVVQQASVNSNEGDGFGWRELFTDQITGETNAELAYGNWTVRARPEFKRYPQEPDSTKLIITGSRTFRTTSSTAIRYGSSWIVSYHNITSSLGGTISNSNGGNVQLSVFRDDTDELIGTGSINGNGTYSFILYDDTLNYFVKAYESNTYKGISKVGTPDSSFDISLSGSAAGGGGGEFYF